MIEVKADSLEASFEALEDDGVEALKAELALLKKRIDDDFEAALPGGNARYFITDVQY